MVTRIAHISDLHLPAPNMAQLAALSIALREAKPDLVLVSGDVTRKGGKAEFEAGRKFLNSLSCPKLIVPGNHDIPAYNIPERIFSPFCRFEEYFGPSDTPIFENEDVLLVGLNTAYGVRLSVDWSLGHAVPERITKVCDIVRTRKFGRAALVTCHHPLLANVFDPYRSRTAGGKEAFERLAEAGMDFLLHGHLHRAASACDPLGGREVCQIGANTALSDRERDGGSGFNLMEFDKGHSVLTAMAWHNDTYVPSGQQDYSLKPIGIRASAS